jgi:hypothetical protein
MPYNRINRFRAENIVISIPAGSIYDTISFRYRKEAGNKDMMSDLHFIHDKQTPVHTPYSISIKPTSVPAGK